MRSTEISKGERATVLDAVLALRPHQWSKNLLVFVPLLLTPRLIGDPSMHGAAWIAVVAFCLCASAGYVINDLLDVEADRAHPTKSKRAFARGAIGGDTGMLMAGGLAALGLGLVLLASPTRVAELLGLYMVVTLAYSAWLKRLLLIDVIVLAALYTLRVLAGAAAVNVVPTPWLLAFSLFIFTSLALVKRYSELHLMATRDAEVGTGRAYRPEDADLVAMLGTASGSLSVLVLALYINSSEVQEGRYESGALLWLLCPLLLYWIGRMWFLARRGALPGDPVAFAIREPASLATGLLAGAVLAGAILL